MATSGTHMPRTHTVNTQLQLHERAKISSAQQLKGGGTPSSFSSQTGSRPSTAASGSTVAQTALTRRTPTTLYSTNQKSVAGSQPIRQPPSILSSTPGMDKKTAQSPRCTSSPSFASNGTSGQIRSKLNPTRHEYTRPPRTNPSDVGPSGKKGPPVEELVSATTATVRQASPRSTVQSSVGHTSVTHIRASGGSPLSSDTSSSSLVNRKHGFSSSIQTKPNKPTDKPKQSTASTAVTQSATNLSHSRCPTYADKTKAGQTNSVRQSSTHKSTVQSAPHPQLKARASASDGKNHASKRYSQSDMSKPGVLSSNQTGAQDPVVKKSVTITSQGQSISLDQLAQNVDNIISAVEQHLETAKPHREEEKRLEEDLRALSLKINESTASSSTNSVTEAQIESGLEQEVLKWRTTLLNLQDRFSATNRRTMHLDGGLIVIDDEHNRDKLLKRYRQLYDSTDIVSEKLETIFTDDAADIEEKSGEYFLAILNEAFTLSNGRINAVLKRLAEHLQNQSDQFSSDMPNDRKGTKGLRTLLKEFFRTKEDTPAQLLQEVSTSARQHPFYKKLAVIDQRRSQLDKVVLDFLKAVVTLAWRMVILPNSLQLLFTKEGETFDEAVFEKHTTSRSSSAVVDTLFWPALIDEKDLCVFKGTVST